MPCMQVKRNKAPFYRISRAAACLLFVLAMLTAGSGCRKNKINLTLDEIEGIWIRRPDNNIQYTGLQVRLDTNFADVLAGTGSNNFPDECRKWRNISPIRDSVFAYEDLGSDGKYYAGQFTVSIRATGWEINTSLRRNLEEGVHLQGEVQSWIRQ